MMALLASYVTCLFLMVRNSATRKTAEINNSFAQCAPLFQYCLDFLGVVAAERIPLSLPPSVPSGEGCRFYLRMLFRSREEGVPYPPLIPFGII